MSTINRIVVKTYAYKLKDFSSIAVRKRGEEIEISKFGISIGAHD